MNDMQLVFSIGIPSLLVILSWIHNNTRLARLEAASDNTNRRIDDLIRGINSDMNALRDSIHRDMVGLHERLATVEARQA